MNTRQIPQRLNGYNMLFAIPKIQADGTPHPGERVIMGHDPTRKHGKFVTAFLNPGHIPAGQPIREWYWGCYFDDLDGALRSLAIRSNFAAVNL